MNEDALAIIMARGGSKRIPRKNVRYFAGAPIIKYSIDAARNWGGFSEIMVSTDDREIAETARGFGAQVPFFRSAATSTDFATTAEVIVEVIESYRAIGRQFRYACCLYAAAPLISTERIAAGYVLLVGRGATSVFPVVRFGYPIQRAVRVEDGKISMVWPEHMTTRSQDLPSCFHDAGQFYWVEVEGFLRERKLFTDNTFAIEIPASEAQDIDTAEDWKIAEMKYRTLKRV